MLGIRSASPFDNLITELSHWDKKSHKILDLSGPELLVISKKLWAFLISILKLELLLSVHLLTKENYCEIVSIIFLNILRSYR